MLSKLKVGGKEARSLRREASAADSRARKASCAARRAKHASLMTSRGVVMNKGGKVEEAIEEEGEGDRERLGEGGEGGGKE
jgi:hypothetical protein